MGEILQEPDSPGIAFLKGAGATVVAVGFPLLAHALFLPNPAGDGFWKGLWVTGVIISIFCFIAGAANAIWALLRRWAYDRVTSDPFH